MIYKTTMSQAYEAAGHTMTDAQLDETYEQMMEQWEDLYQNHLSELSKKWTDKTGHTMIDGLTRGNLIAASRQMATDEIRELWLDPLTQEVIQTQLAQDEETPSSLQVLNSPDLWKTQWYLLTNDDQTFDLACQLWPEKTTKWISVASALMQVYEHQDKYYPTSPESNLLPSFEKKIDDALEGK